MIIELLPVPPLQQAKVEARAEFISTASFILVFRASCVSWWIGSSDWLNRAHTSVCKSMLGGFQKPEGPDST